jgi:hypothetical protein
MMPSVTGTLEAAVEIFYYSYYYTDFLAPSDIVDGVCANQEGELCHTVNCWDYDLADRRCRSLMASRLDWHDYVGKAVARGFEYLLGTVFCVLEPQNLAGKYLCLDRCPACTGKKQLNFLSLTHKLPWNQELSVLVSS